MMANLNLYNWQAVDNKGELQNGNGLAPDADCLLSQLTERDLLPVSWKREKVYRPGTGNGSRKLI